MKISMKDLRGWTCDHPYPRTLATIGGASICSMLALELPSNHELWNMQPGPALLELMLIFCLLSLLFYLPRRRKTPAIAGVVALAAIGIAEYFVITFKSMPIQPGDLFALSTAATVAGSYTYELSPYCFMGLAAAAAGIALIARIPRDICGRGPRRANGAAPASGAEASSTTASVEPVAESTASTAPATSDTTSPAPAPSGESHEKPESKLPLSVDRRTALIAGAALGAQAFISYYDLLGIKLHTWKPLDSYYSQGFLPTFISSAQKMVPPKPKHYSGSEAAATIKRLAGRWSAGAHGIADPARKAAVAQFDELQPSVVCIMNESFADLSIFNGLGCGYKGPERFKAIDDALLQGVSYMSAFGAGTCNSEFEFLTGHSMAYLGAGVYPFMTYNLEPTENLARQFKKLGYRAVAMHPNHATNWNRENVFADMGFDEFLSIEDFAGAPELCRKVTDAATYDKCLEVLRQSDKPVFIHDVTMQNHSAYDTGLVPPDQQLHLALEGVSDKVVTWTDEYCSLMEASDVAFADFLKKLRALDRPVVVVMYGDHQPFFTDRYNDLYFTDEDEATHTERIWQTRYVVWANYDVAGNAQASEELDTSIDNVGALALNAIGAPLTAYQRARLQNRTHMPAINVVGTQDAHGTWHTAEAKDLPAKTADARDRLECMQYRKLFDHAGSVFSTHKQTSANETDPNAAPGADA